MLSARRLRPGTALLACLATALGLTACTASAAASAPASVSYLAKGPSAVALLRWAPASGGGVSGTLVLDTVSGAVPHEIISAKSYPLAGRVRSGSVTFTAAGSTEHGTLAGTVLTLASPLPGGVAVPGGFSRAAPSSYDQAVAALRDRVRLSDGAEPSAAGLAAAYRATIQARHVLVRNLFALRDDRRLAHNDLELTRTAEQGALAAARPPAHPVLACDDAVEVSLDAEYVADEATGMISDRQTFSQDLPLLTSARTALVIALRAAVTQARSDRSGPPVVIAPARAMARNVVRSSRLFLARAIGAADYYIRSMNRSVMQAYAGSAAASRAGDCHTASSPPPPLRQID
jgi:hypothetical protein